MKRTVAIASALLACSLAAQERTSPPPPGPPHAVVVPQAVEKTLANGLRVIVVEKKGLPLVAARLMIRTGGEADPPQRAGLADMTASLLTKGTKTRSAEEIARGIEALGATIESGAAWDFSYVALSAMSSNFPTALGYVADVAMHPAFKQDEIERLRAQNVDALSVAMRDPDALSGFVATRVVFGASPYGHNLGGTPKSLAAIGRDDIAGFHQQHYGPANAILVVAGNVDAAAVLGTAEKLFGGWTAPAGPDEKAAPAAPDAGHRRVVIIDMPDAGQSAVVLTRRAIARTDPAYLAAQVANMILGGDYSSRLNQEVRIKRGLSYGAGSSIESRRWPGPFTASAQTKNESAIDVAKLMNEEVAKLAATPVEESELIPRKANLVGRFGRAIATTAGLVSRMAGLALYGLPLSDINQYVAHVEAVSAANVRDLSSRIFVEPAPDVVIVGDVKKFGDALKTAFPDAETIPIDQLDLDSPTLRKQ